MNELDVNRFLPEIVYDEFYLVKNSKADQRNSCALLAAFPKLRLGLADEKLPRDRIDDEHNCPEQEIHGHAHVPVELQSKDLSFA